jgi:hypothetical protein
LVAWLLGCLVAWLLGCLVAWLLGCLVAWLLGCLVAWLLGWLVGCLLDVPLFNALLSYRPFGGWLGVLFSFPDINISMVPHSAQTHTHITQQVSLWTQKVD